METISWKAGSHFPVEAQVAADTIRALQLKLGKEAITAKDLLDASRDVNAPLHNCFEWDDTVAAELYRTDQARHIINNIIVTFIGDNNEPITTRYLVNVQPVAPKKQGEFVSFNVAFNNDDYKKQILHNALNELRAFQRKYQIYHELSRVFDAINAVAIELNQ